MFKSLQIRLEIELKNFAKKKIEENKIKKEKDKAVHQWTVMRDVKAFSY